MITMAPFVCYRNPNPTATNFSLKKIGRDVKDGHLFYVSVRTDVDHPIFGFEQSFEVIDKKAKEFSNEERSEA